MQFISNLGETKYDDLQWTQSWYTLIHDATSSVQSRMQVYLEKIMELGLWILSVCFPPQLPETVTCVLSGLRGAPSGQWPVWPGRELFGLLWKYLYLELLGRGTLNFLQILIHYNCCVRGQNFHNFYSTLIMYFSALLKVVFIW